MSNRRTKSTKLVALSGIIAALSVVVMLVAYFPYFTYAMPAIAGCFLIVLVFESGKKSAFTVFAAVSLLSFFICEKEAALSYIFFFGYYPIVKALLERINLRPLEYVAKFALFNVAFAAILLLGTFVFGIDAGEMGDFGKYTVLVLLAAGNLMFICYDFCLTKLVSLYLRKYRAKIAKMLR
ncbi:MAG: hypothetical protein UH824_02595 [Acutalibacteraceae bacterium]|nr:hypothetical protein [Acutalibacteraceae bacterium]